MSSQGQAMPTEPKMVLQQDGQTWIGWIDNIPGINSQADTREELAANLQSALSEWHEMERTPPPLNPEP
jgi:predicted RNase H-like HicB family nuclease